MQGDCDKQQIGCGSQNGAQQQDFPDAIAHHQYTTKPGTGDRHSKTEYLGDIGNVRLREPHIREVKRIRHDPH